MVLSSQSSRSGRSSGRMSSSRRKRFGVFRWLVTVAVLIVVVAIVYWIFSPSEKTSLPASSHLNSKHPIAQVPPNSNPEQSTKTALPNDHSASGSGGSSSKGATEIAKSDSQQKPLSESGNSSKDSGLKNNDVATLILDGTPAPAKSPAPSAQSSDNPVAQASSYTDLSNADMAAGMKLIANKKWIEGRKVLSKVLFSDKSLSEADARTIRDTLTSVNKQLIFSDHVYTDAPLQVSYKVQSGDTLSAIAPHFDIPYQFIERINHVQGRFLRAGQHIKIIKGPFNVRVIKHLFLLDVYLTAPDGLPVYVCSHRVGLGKDNATPVGKWIIQAGRKVKNPGYTNPRTGKHIDRNDPKNPVGEFWMGLEGVGKNTKGLTSYGIHGTIDPSSIGKEDSLGCIRLGDQDIKHLFYMLVGGKSKVEVLP